LGFRSIDPYRRDTGAMKALYTASATAHGGREGRVTTSDGHLSADLTLPGELGGPGGAGTNPEQLFAAGYAACFESALRLVARQTRRPLADASITARVTLSAVEGKYILSVELEGKVDGLSQEEALTLMHAAHQVCPYSIATRGNIDVKLSAG
jgi:Ohr subfamily peroxiredoxin